MVQTTLDVAPSSSAGQSAAQPVPLANLGLLALSIAQQTKDGIKHFDIALHPADLGSIQISMSVDASGQTKLHMQAENPQTLQMLRQDASQLQNALKDAGLNLSGSGLNFSLKGQHQQQDGSAQGNGGRGSRSALALSAVASVAAAGALSTYSAGASSARLDIQV